MTCVPVAFLAAAQAAPGTNSAALTVRSRNCRPAKRAQYKSAPTLIG